MLDTGTISAAVPVRKNFIRCRQIIARQVRFDDRDLALRCQFDHNLPRDAERAPGADGWRFQSAIANNENIIPGAFGDMSLRIEHDCLDRTRVDRFDLRQDIIEIVQRFDRRAYRRRIACVGVSDQLQPLAMNLLGIQLESGPQ